MNKVYFCIDKLLNYAKKNLLLDPRNEEYKRNEIFALFGLDSYINRFEAEIDAQTPEKLLAEFTNACIEAKLFTDYEAEFYCDQVMGILSLLPSQIEDHFQKIYNDEGSSAATKWLYNYAVKSDYVKKAKLDLNPRFETNNLIVTINKAKPEFRDPKKAQSGNSTKGGYPKCSICHENEGFAGRNKKTLRTVELNLDGHKWFWQFSPYGYFYEHGITVDYNHTPMHADKDTFKRLISFVDQYPHWFIGANAALPRIGGSVLAHDHYQGGGERLPMQTAKAAYTLKSNNYPSSIVEVVDWPNTVIRVVSHSKEDIIEISEKIRNKWINYNNSDLGIIASDEFGTYSAISPTVIKTKRGYEMSIILRNNITTKDYPDGVFHAHPEFHIIKKESIGLIEAQGLFILPGRLEAELKAIEELIVNQSSLTEEYKDYQMIYDEIIALCNNNFNKENVHNAVIKELGSVCSRILDNTAVFKDKKLTVKFMEDLGFIC